MRIVYVAGPFAAPCAWEVEHNVRLAEACGLEVARLGAMPLIPHANTRFFHGVTGIAASFWYRGTLELLLRCDAMIVVGDWESSRGSKAELRACDEHDIPFFWSLEDLRTWLEGTPLQVIAGTHAPQRRKSPTATYIGLGQTASMLAQEAELLHAERELSEAEGAVDAALKRAEEGVKTCIKACGEPSGEPCGEPSIGTASKPDEQT